MPSNKVGKYSLHQTIGEGAFGKVKLASDAHGAQYAIKIMEKEHIERNGLTLQVRREIAVMKAMKHPNIVNLHEVLNSSKKLYMVMDLVTGGELFDAVAEKGRLEEDAARCYFQQLIDGIEYCHSRHVYHRDLKPENLMISGDKRFLKITDFGLASIKAHNATTELLHTVMGSPHYIAPEIITSAKDGYDGGKVDVWACGVILYGMLAGSLPFDEQGTKALYHAIVHDPLVFPRHFSLDVKGVLQGMLQKDPAQRSSITDVRVTHWFQRDYSPPAVVSPTPLPVGKHGKDGKVARRQVRPSKNFGDAAGQAGAAAGSGSASALASPTADRKDREKRKARKERKSHAIPARPSFVDQSQKRALSSASGASAASITSETQSSGDGPRLPDVLPEDSAAHMRTKRTTLALKEMKTRMTRRKSQIDVSTSGAATSPKILPPRLAKLASSSLRSADDPAKEATGAPLSPASPRVGQRLGEPSTPRRGPKNDLMRGPEVPHLAHAPRKSGLQAAASFLADRSPTTKASPTGEAAEAAAREETRRKHIDKRLAGRTLSQRGAALVGAIALRRSFRGRQSEIPKSQSQCPAPPQQAETESTSPAAATTPIADRTVKPTSPSEKPHTALPTSPSFAGVHRNKDLLPREFHSRKDSKQSDDESEDARKPDVGRRQGAVTGLPKSTSRMLDRKPSRLSGVGPQIRQSASFHGGTSAASAHEPSQQPANFTRRPSMGTQTQDKIIQPALLPAKAIKQASKNFGSFALDPPDEVVPLFAQASAVRVFSQDSANASDLADFMTDDHERNGGSSQAADDDLERDVQARMGKMASSRFDDACAQLPGLQDMDANANDAELFGAIEVDVTGEDSSNSEGEPEVKSYKGPAKGFSLLRLGPAKIPKLVPKLATSTLNIDSSSTPLSQTSHGVDSADADAYDMSSPLTPLDDVQSASDKETPQSGTKRSTSSNKVTIADDSMRSKRSEDSIQESNTAARRRVPASAASSFLLSNKSGEHLNRAKPGNSSFCFQQLSKNKLLIDLAQSQGAMDAPVVRAIESGSGRDSPTAEVHDVDDIDFGEADDEPGDDESITWENGVPQSVHEELYKQDHENGYPPCYHLGFDVHEDCDPSLEQVDDCKCITEKRQTNLQTLLDQSGKKFLVTPAADVRAKTARHAVDDVVSAYMVAALQKYTVKVYPSHLPSGVKGAHSSPASGNSVKSTTST